MDICSFKSECSVETKMIHESTYRYVQIEHQHIHLFISSFKPQNENEFNIYRSKSWTQHFFYQLINTKFIYEQLIRAMPFSRIYMLQHRHDNHIGSSLLKPPSPNRFKTKTISKRLNFQLFFQIWTRRKKTFNVCPR